jgi:hypothetical protein
MAYPASACADPSAGFSLRIEGAFDAAVKRPQCGYAREFDGAAMFGGIRQKLGRRQGHGHMALGGGDGLNEVRDSLTQGRQLDAARQFNGLGKTAIP